MSGPIAALGFVFAIVSGNAAVNQKIDGRYADASYAFWEARDKVDATVARMGASGKIFEMDDGIMAYALTAPTMNAVGLAVDREASREFHSNRCWDVAYERGFNIVSSVTYWGYLDEQRIGYVPPRDDSELLQIVTGPNAMNNLKNCGMDRFEFSTLPTMKIGSYGIHFFAFKPKIGGT